MIACLAYGSLVWDPRRLPLAGEWRPDGPRLPVEFARQSRDDRLTLVIVEGAGVAPSRALWAPLAVASTAEARRALAAREGCEERWVAAWPGGAVERRGEHWTPGPAAPGYAAVARWAAGRRLEGVLWSALPYGLADRPGTVPSPEESLAFLGGLSGARLAAAAEYVRRAPTQTRTPLRARLEAALGQAEGKPRGGRIGLRLYAELDERLPAERRQAAFEHVIRPGTAVGEVAAELGVPAGEIDLALVDGRSVGLEHRLRGGERLSLFPVFESLDVGPVSAVRRRPLRRTRFVLDVHLGRLAGYLRLLGFDALYRNDLDDPELVEISLGERRLLLSRDRELLARSELTHAYRVRATAPRRQLAEVVERLDLTGSATPFTRCLACNGRLRPVPLEAVRERLPPRVRQRHRRFQLCPGCDRVLWRGSHYRRMRRWVAEVLGGGEPR